MQKTPGGSEILQDDFRTKKKVLHPKRIFEALWRHLSIQKPTFSRMRFRSQFFLRQVQFFKAEAKGVVLAVSFFWWCKANPVTCACCCCLCDLRYTIQLYLIYGHVLYGTVRQSFIQLMVINRNTYNTTVKYCTVIAYIRILYLLGDLLYIASSSSRYGSIIIWGQNIKSLTVPVLPTIK